jgi:hypothetical protein
MFFLDYSNRAKHTSSCAAARLKQRAARTRRLARD